MRIKIHKQFKKQYFQLDPVTKKRVRKLIKRLRKGDYRVIFRIEEKKVIALRVLARKDFEKILKSF